MAKIKGINTVKKLLKELRKNGQEAANRGILKSAKLIESDAKSNVPVDKGLLQSSIGLEQKSNTTYVFAGAKYAPYQEFGTGALTQAPKGYEAYAKEFFVNGKGITRPQPFLFPAFFKHQSTIIPNIEEEMQKLADDFNKQ